MEAEGDRLNCVRITEADCAYAPAVTRLAQAFGRRAVVPLLGAGISSGYPSWVPAATDRRAN
jgi:hypothetical protein